MSSFAKLLSTQPGLVNGIIPPLVEGFPVTVVELHEVPVGPFLQPVEVPHNHLVCQPLLAVLYCLRVH